MSQEIVLGNLQERNRIYDNIILATINTPCPKCGEYGANVEAHSTSASDPDRKITIHCSDCDMSYEINGLIIRSRQDDPEDVE